MRTHSHRKRCVTQTRPKSRWHQCGRASLSESWLRWKLGGCQAWNRKGHAGCRIEGASASLLQPPPPRFLNRDDQASGGSPMVGSPEPPSGTAGGAAQTSLHIPVKSGTRLGQVSAKRRAVSSETLCPFWKCKGWTALLGSSHVPIDDKLIEPEPRPN
jgi:hypothetical protein